MRRGKKGEDGDISSDEKTPDERTSLEKTFFFARKFDFNDFIYFSNLLSDKAIKYKSNTIYFKNMLCEAKELMARKEGKLSFDEAKYLFFWGMDSYFKKEDDKQEDTIKEEGE
jgi:CRISPR-associated protein Csh1